MSATEALTAINRFADNLAVRAPVLEERAKEMGLEGVSFGERTDRGKLVKLADPRELIANVLQITGGDIGEITKLFGKRGQKVVRGFTAGYLRAEEKEKGSGAQAVRDQFNEMMEQEMTPAQIADFSKSRLEDPDLQFKEAAKEFNTAVGEQLLPAVTKLIPEFVKLMPHIRTAARLFGMLIESLADNPILTIGTLIATRVVASLAAAHIGSVVSNFLATQISNAGTKTGGGVFTTKAGKTHNIGGAMAMGLTLGAGAALFAR